MADVLSSSCDVCGTIKREANHWFRVWKYYEGLVVIAPWNYDLDEEPPVHKHPCGEDHALKLAARLLGNQKSSIVEGDSGVPADSDGERGKP